MTAAGPHADAVRVLREWRPHTTWEDGGSFPAESAAWDVRAQEALRHSFRTLLDTRQDACLRDCEPGHITASAMVVDGAREAVLLTLHPRVGRWLQLGGHCEAADSTLSGAALREATEESGIDGLTIDPEPLHLDVHPVTCSLGSPTRHFDVRFLVRAPSGARATRSDESLDLRWWPLDAPPNGAEDLAPLLAAARERLTQQGCTNHAQ